MPGSVRIVPVLVGWLAASAACGEGRDGTPPMADGGAAADIGAEAPPTPFSSADVLVFFTRNERPEPVARSVALSAGGMDGQEERERLLRLTLEELLEGPSAEEEAGGLSSWFSSATAGAIRDVEVDTAGRVRVDFDDLSRVIPGASSSFGSTVLLHELNGTVFQFRWVESVEYRSEGSCDAFWNWLQRRCEVVRRPSPPDAPS